MSSLPVYKKKYGPEQTHRERHNGKVQFAIAGAEVGASG